MPRLSNQNRVPKNNKQPNIFLLGTQRQRCSTRTHAAAPAGRMGLSAEKEELFREAFEILGKKQPTIDQYTVSVILRSLGQNPTTDEVKELYNKFSGGASTVDVDVVVKIAGAFETTMATKDQKTDLTQAFAVFDKDGSGKISAAELRSVIANTGEKMEEDEIEDMMAEADKDGNGLIDYGEFLNVLFHTQQLPPKVHIPDDLKPYMKPPKD